MADDITTPVSDGTVIATDDVGSKHFQYVKMTFGADGTATKVSSADPLPVTAASLPLPSGASTAANQTTIIGHVDGIETALTTTNGHLAAIETAVEGTLTASISGSVAVTGTFWQATQPVSIAGTVAVSAASLPLPSGAATSANQTTIIGHVDGIESSLSTIAASVAGATPAGTNFIGTVASPVSVLELTFSLDTSAYADGDVLADRQAIAGAVRTTGGCALLQSLTIHDEDDVGTALDLVFLSADNSLGTENSAPSITDANAREILGIVSIVAEDYKDLGGVKIATKTGIGLVLEGASGATSVYVGLIARGAGTYTGSGIRARFGVVQA